MSARGQGGVWRPKYTDKKTGERKRQAVYWCRYSIGGKKVRESTGETTQREAVRFLNKRLAERGRGINRRDLEKVTFAELAALVRADYTKNGRKSLDRLELSISHLEDAFGTWRAVDIGEEAIDRYAADRLGEGAANATVNRELAALRRMFNLGKRARMVGRVPVFDMLTERNTRTGFVDDGTFEALRAKLPPRLRPLAVVAFTTGWRLSEILSREWRHVDLAEGWLRLEPGETKNDEGRQFPLIPRLREALERQHERKREIEKRTGRVVRHLFFYYDGKRAGDEIKDFRGAWAKATEKAGCPDLLFHDFRRTAVRNLVRAGVPEQVAMKLTGHLTRSVFDRYAIVDETMLREGAEKLARHLSEREPERKVLAIDGS